MKIVDFCEKCLGMKLYKYQREALKNYDNKIIVNKSRLSGNRRLYYEMMDKMTSILNYEPIGSSLNTD